MHYQKIATHQSNVAEMQQNFRKGAKNLIETSEFPALAFSLPPRSFPKGGQGLSRNSASVIERPARSGGPRPELPTAFPRGAKQQESHVLSALPHARPAATTAAGNVTMLHSADYPARARIELRTLRHNQLCRIMSDYVGVSAT